MTKPEHFIEVPFRGIYYRYYGWAHVPGAKCVGEGDWRRIGCDGKEFHTNGAIIPGKVLQAVGKALEHQARDTE